MVYGDRVNSKALIYGDRVNSKALVYGDRVNSRALLFGDRLNSRALVYGDRANSTALLFGDRVNSRALVYGDRVNSRALVSFEQLPNTIPTLIRTMSNALVYGNKLVKTFPKLIRTMSNTLVYDDKLVKTLPKLIRTMSNTLVYDDKLVKTLPKLIRTMSNTLVYDDKLVKTFPKLIRTMSNALKYGDRVNSNTLLSRISPRFTISTNAVGFTPDDSTFIRTISNALLYSDRVNSRALVYGDRVNSTALVYGDLNSEGLEIDSELVRTMSNALLYGDRVNSKALVYGLKVISASVQALNVQTFPTPGISSINGDYNQTFDVWISNDEPVNITTNSIVNGQGHSWTFVRNQAGIVTVDDGVTVEFRNVVFKDFSDKVFSLAGNAEVIFGDGTVIELADAEVLSRDWTFAGNAAINGFGNPLDLASSQITAKAGSSLSIQNTLLLNVKKSNIHVDHNGLLKLNESKLCLSQDFSFTTGRFNIENDVTISGTCDFMYTTTSASMIKSNGTLILTNGINFNYQPGVENKDLIHMEDVTSIMFLKGCSLTSSTAGMRLTNGTLCVESRNYLFNDGAVNASQGFVLGNGILDNDLHIEILPGGSLDLQSGSLSYDNVDPAG